MSEPIRYRALDELLGVGVLPDRVLRAGSKYGAGARLRRERRGGIEAQERRLSELIARMSTGPVAEATTEANEQHYELPAEFFGLILGPRRKYSCCLYQSRLTTLAQAEEAMLALYCERAGVRDGMEILDLGCGWGSVSLWLAERYPEAKILGLSNSNSQRDYIEGVARERGFSNLEIVTADINGFDTERRFDRVISIEMFEHMRNWAELLRRIAGWLRDDGKLFVHVFSQRQVPYEFRGTWASARFFTEGRMPSHDLMLRFAQHMRVTDRWAVDGIHYARTLKDWLQRLDGNSEAALEILARGRSAREAKKLLAAWRLFLISTDEIWSYRGGDEWMVSHYLLEPTG